MGMQGQEAPARAIADLINEFAWRVDNSRGDEVAELFVESGTIETPHFTLANRAEIDTWFKKTATNPDTRLSRHMLSNLRIRPDGDDAYIAECYALTVIGTPPGPSLGGKMGVGTTTDRIIFENGKPLFAWRKLTVAVQGHLTIEQPAA